LDFKKSFKKRLIDVDMTTATLAKLLGKNRETVNRWMKEPENVQPSDFLLLLSALKYTPDEARAIYSEIVESAWR